MTAMRRWLETVNDSWHEHAVCRSRNPDVWKLFEPLNEKEPEHWARARAETAIEDFCLVCPVMVLCGQERDRHEYQGVWGGEWSEKRGIVSVETGMVTRKFASQMTGAKDRDDTEETA